MAAASGNASSAKAASSARLTTFMGALVQGGDPDTMMKCLREDAASDCQVLGDPSYFGMTLAASVRMGCLHHVMELQKMGVDLTMDNYNAFHAAYVGKQLALITFLGTGEHAPPKSVLDTLRAIAARDNEAAVVEVLDALIKSTTPVQTEEAKTPSLPAKAKRVKTPEEIREANSKALVTACVRSNLDKVAELLSLPDEEIDVNVQDDLPFRCACCGGDERIVSIFLSLEGNRAVNMEKTIGYALLNACRTGHLTIWQLLMDHPRMPDMYMGSTLESAFKDAVSGNHIAIVQDMFKREGLPVDPEVLYGGSIFLACMMGHRNMVFELLLQSIGVKLTEKMRDWRSKGFIEACRRGHPQHYQVVKLLMDPQSFSVKFHDCSDLNIGIDMHSNEDSAFYHAAANDHCSIVKELLSKFPASVIASRDFGAFRAACSHGYSHTVQTIIDAGRDVIPDSVILDCIPLAYSHKLTLNLLRDEAETREGCAVFQVREERCEALILAQRELQETVKPMLEMSSLGTVCSPDDMEEVLLSLKKNITNFEDTFGHFTDIVPSKPVLPQGDEVPRGALSQEIFCATPHGNVFCYVDGDKAEKYSWSLVIEHDSSITIPIMIDRARRYNKLTAKNPDMMRLAGFRTKRDIWVTMEEMTRASFIECARVIMQTYADRMRDDTSSSLPPALVVAYYHVKTFPREQKHALILPSMYELL